MHDAKLYVRAAFYEQRVEQKYTGLHISLLKEQIFQKKGHGTTKFLTDKDHYCNRKQQFINIMSK